MNSQPAQHFIPADTLKKNFEVLGHYYQVSGKPQRRLLEIRRHTAKNELRKDTVYDALVIMMNPGGSRPKSPGSAYHAELVPAHPDTTQYQIMRVMEACGWNFVRVINLSDTCEPKSKVFLPQLNNQPTKRSIFDLQRAGELKELLSAAKNVICAWGMDKRLTPLANKALQALKLHGRSDFLGVQGHQNHSFRHPLPRSNTARKEWLADFLRSSPIVI